MSRKKASLQINQFNGGLNTDSSPLNFPIEGSYDELNLNLNRDGSRVKRLGFDLEIGGSTYDTGITPDSTTNLGRSMYKWSNAGGDPEKDLLVVQVGCTLHVYDFSNDPVSTTRIYTRTHGSGCYTATYSYATVDGLLVVCNGEKSVYVYEYDSTGPTVTESEETLYIRDLFGVEAIENSVALTLPQNLNVRPATLGDEHTYNLRNKGFNRPWFINNTETLGDPIAAFFTASGDTVYPSNADNINTVIYSDVNDTNNRLVERFFSTNLFNEKPTNTDSPTGSFIIDALERGDSREAEELAMRTDHSELTLTATALPTDKTPGGATTVSEYSGHIFFGGFSGDVEGGDSKSPRMSSYLLFSLRVKDISDIGRCYQVADPTDKDDSVIVDDDGGFIRIDNAYDISKLISLGGSLFIFARNGVWRLSGTDNSAFTATNYQVSKVSETGCVSEGSVVQTENEIYYWGDDGIYAISINEFGQPVSTSISEGVIQTEYLNTITSKQREIVSGSYDNYQKQVRWVYTDLETGSLSEELIFDTRFRSFLKNRVAGHTNEYPKIYDVTDSTPFITGTVQDRESRIKESIYLVITDFTTSIQFGLGKFSSSEYYDWSQDISTDYDCFLQTGFLTLGEPRSKKQPGTIWAFFNRTETGFDGFTEPINSSSCLISTRYGWSDTSVSNKWSTPRQAYRVNRLYIPDGPNDTYDTGFNLIYTRNRVRGFGNSLSVKFESEAGKNMHIYGWATDVFASGEE